MLKTAESLVHNRRKVLDKLQKIRKFRIGSTAKKVTASDLAKPGPHIHIFFLSKGSRVLVEMGTKSEKVCMCVCVCVCDAFLLASISPYISKVNGPWPILAQIW